MASYPFPEIEPENECDLEHQIDNSIPLLNSMLTLVYLPRFKCFSKSALDPVLIHCEIELPIFQDSHLELDQYITSESPINKLASFPFKEIEADKNVASILKFVIQFKSLNQY